MVSKTISRDSNSRTPAMKNKEPEFFGPYESVDEMFANIERKYQAYPLWKKAQIKLKGKWSRRPRPIDKHQHRKQRIEKGYSYRDLWSFDHYLLRLLISGIEEFRVKMHSYPCDMEFDEWNDTLIAIVEGIKQGQAYLSNDDCNTEDWQEVKDKQREEFDKAWAELGKHFFDLLD